MLCEAVSANVAHDRIVGETPTEVGRWLRGANRGIELVPEKPSPEWVYRHLPNFQGSATSRKTPTEVGSTVTYHKFSKFLPPL
jgi:hypothetical protein